jgi:RNA polymerase sigma factor (sigma-70 family)
MSAVASRAPVHVGGLTDEELVQLARAGCEPAFEAIVHRYRAPLVSYCRRWLDAHRAEEVVQHTLLKAFLCVRDDDRPLTLRPWLYRVAHNAALNAVEKKGSDWEQLDENYDGVPQPPQVAEQRAHFLSVVGEIEALPSRQREALLLNEFEGRCYAEIAAELGTSESGVRGLLRRARRQLREAAAVVLLPFPAVRELFRSDAGRNLQFERAGELIGTAGAAGGVGAVGGLAKVAAGMLAAGTIAAGGGTAIQNGDDARRGPDARAADVPSPERIKAAREVRRVLTGDAPQQVGPFAAERIAVGGAQLAAGAGLPAETDGAGESLAGVEPDSAETTEPGVAEPAPALPVTPTVPIGSEEEPAEEPPPEEEAPPAGEVEEGDGEQEPSEEPPPPTDEQSADSTEPETSDPDAAPAAPIMPL